MTNTVTDVQHPDYWEVKKREFTDEDFKRWQDCMQNSSILIPTLLTAAAGYGLCFVTPFRAKAKYFAAVAGFTGMISNRISTSKQCLAKIKPIWGNDVREGYRETNPYNKDRSLRYKGFSPLDVQSEIQTSGESSTEIVFDDYPSMNTYDTYSSLNDSGDLQSSVEETDLTEPMNMQKSASYDELRHKNREEFYNRNKQWYTAREAQSASEAQYAKDEAVLGSQEPSSNAPSTQRKNEYGDVWG
ncbi:hypothetical protein DMN91_010831 [Ooceraea biroi]|uniref:OCIA domain-containing protein n=1 Tax=Ooceraea biroi TaxID=2015173 RepID=A0A026WWI9_OOCBI|nr:uncharacterized protein LOC105274598 [Ooceraea biroi]EZA60440.1 hypothetical protein X777_13529 [Ooceraea biroi]RLU16763.1 hypothetical protein DMN91_010831 [Ooceraea biroi]